MRNADMGGCPSGQRELTVNQPADAYGGSNPPPPTISAHIAQQVEHILGKNEVTSSSLVVGSLVFVCVHSYAGAMRFGAMRQVETVHKDGFAVFVRIAAQTA